MKAEEFRDLVFAIIEEIPCGKVISYSQLAKISGYPNNARQVGSVLSKSPLAENYPCHRVVHNNGSLVSFWAEQKTLLQNEGIEVINNKVDMIKYGWI